MDTPQHSLLMLSLVKGVGPAAIGSLLKVFGEPQHALTASPQELIECCNLSVEQAEGIVRAAESEAVAEECQLLERHQTHLICLGDAEYPALLRQLPHPPPLLYCRGLQPLPQGPTLSIVGSRECSTYAQRQTQRLLESLAQQIPQLVVVSGLARGLDGTAHACALELGLPTIAVLGCGLASVYPAEHRQMAERITKQGALLSELPMRSPPHAYHFPTRNRIISGLGAVLAVMEAGAKSGALITAGHSQNYGRPVFALPGDVDRIGSMGVNYLLQSGQAQLLLGSKPIAEALLADPQPSNAASSRASARASSRTSARSTASGQPSLADSPSPALNQTQTHLLEFLKKEPMHPNDLSRISQLPMERLLGLLLELELAGNVYCDENSLYRRA